MFIPKRGDNLFVVNTTWSFSSDFLSVEHSSYHSQA